MSFMSLLRHQMRLVCAVSLLFCLPWTGALARDLADTVAVIKPSIVGVGTYQRTRQPAVRLLGTGFVVADGRHVITNLHVIPKVIDSPKQETLAIFAGTGEDPDVRLAVLEAADTEHDLALLKFSDAPLPPLTLGDSGDELILIAVVSRNEINTLDLEEQGNVLAASQRVLVRLRN